MNRAEMLERAGEREKIWDFIIIGGGATGVGCALDAASRGFSVLLLEQADFGKGTSSRSTKLIHGGVRYLAQGNLSLVRESLKERGNLLKNAPHLVRRQAFVVPVYNYWDKFFYGAGLKTYNLLSGKLGFGKSEVLSKEETIERLPNIKRQELHGGILYFDGQFDDTRLLINLVRSAARQDAVLVNYARVFAFARTGQNKIDGVNFQDEISGEIFSARGKMVINATGAFCDFVRKMSDRRAENMIAPSQGIHLVFDRQFLSSASALMIPKTPDGRVLFAIPFHDKTLIGTTETPVEKAELEPKALDEEIEFILETAQNYLEDAPRREHIRSVFAGIRPLVKSQNVKNTASLARDHIIEIDESNLLTVTGGKWTTYRRMAQEAIDQAIKIAGLPEKACVTENLKIHGFAETVEEFGDLTGYGTDALEIQKLARENPTLAEKLDARLPYQKAEIIWAVRHEMAQTVEDALARRTRALFLDAAAALEIAPQVAAMMAAEAGKDESWIGEQLQAFNQIARHYLVRDE